MAQRLYQQFQKTLATEVISIFANIPIGATGAVGTLAKSANMGIKSVTRTSAGLYVITFGNSVDASIDKYVSLLGVDQVVLYNGISAVSQFNIVSEAVAASGSVTIQYAGPTNSSTTTPVAVDPDSGSILYLEFRLRNSNVQ